MTMNPSDSSNVAGRPNRGSMPRSAPAPNEPGPSLSTDYNSIRVMLEEWPQGSRTIADTETSRSWPANTAYPALPSPFPPATGTVANHQWWQQASLMARQDIGEPFTWVPGVPFPPLIERSLPTTGGGGSGGTRPAAFPTRVSRPNSGRRSEQNNSMTPLELRLVHGASLILAPDVSEEQRHRWARMIQMRRDHQARRNRLRAGEPRVRVETRNTDREMTNAPPEDDLGELVEDFDNLGVSSDVGELADEFGNLDVSDDIDGEMQVDTRPETQMPSPRTQTVVSDPARHRSRMEGYRVCRHTSRCRRACRTGFETEF
ncbi:hypothetical protein CDEST_10918 [Colletotrichum destructivum]|uniref:BZIP domain-containing protein n=1 Tax=Colletotrichum destructivum TaxID=34406 RepID=A0AAX4IRR7_9PEZI|nr:hypothetical protein CDEST_10918 [Colletotrichum destructivum]